MQCYIYLTLPLELNPTSLPNSYPSLQNQQNWPTACHGILILKRHTHSISFLVSSHCVHLLQSPQNCMSYLSPHLQILLPRYTIQLYTYLVIDRPMITAPQFDLPPSSCTDSQGWIYPIFCHKISIQLLPLFPTPQLNPSHSCTHVKNPFHYITHNLYV